MSEKNILLVEDDKNLGFVIQDNLMQSGYKVVRCHNGEEGLNTFINGTFDLCILDVMLPKRDGFSLARRIRASNANVPLLFLTAKAMQEDKLTGFKAGGDDYITKPFHMKELLYRIEVFLKRSQLQPSHRLLFEIGNYTFDYNNLVLSINHSERVLTQKEANILKCFCENRGMVLKREDILTEVWGSDDYFLGRSMDVFISKLRKYLKDDPQIEIINYHGVGFKFSVNSAS